MLNATSTQNIHGVECQKKKVLQLKLYQYKTTL